VQTVLSEKLNAYIQGEGDSIDWIGGKVYIQGVTEGTDNTSGGCSLGQTIPI
jgi:hypothetical protein